MKMIKRELYLSQIERLIDKEPIKIITGVRRSGKTYLLKSIREELKSRGVDEENIFLISFESMRYNRIEDFRQLDECIMNLTENARGKVYLLFDEIQNVKNWERSINACRVDLDCDIYITGSNSELLSGEMATLISGRYYQINVYPFSFAEFLQYLDEKVLDHVHGSWFHQLDEHNQVKETVWPGKPDLYHALQATLIPYHRVDLSIICAVKEQ